MPEPASPRHYRVEFVPLRDPARVRSLWLELESRAEGSYFQSWAWIGSWLRLICPPHIAHLLTVERDGRLAGIGVLTKRRRFLGLGPLHLRLHETGDQALDDITIEYNGLLSEKGLEREVLAAAVSYLTRHDRRWLTLHMPGIENQLIPAEGFASMDLDMRQVTRPVHSIDLDALRGDTGDYVASLRSAKTRSSLRLTERKLATQHGPILLRPARNKEERHEFFNGLVALHQAHWVVQRNHGGAFADPRILHFHKALIDTARDTRHELIAAACD